jgi:hypothetical protein
LISGFRNGADFKGNPRTFEAPARQTPEANVSLLQFPGNRSSPFSAFVNVIWGKEDSAAWYERFNEGLHLVSERLATRPGPA